MEMNQTHNFEAFESSSSFNSIPPLGLSSQMEIEMSSVDSNIHDWFLLEIVELTYFYYLLLYFYWLNLVKMYIVPTFFEIEWLKSLPN